MIKLYEGEIDQKDLDYEEILKSVVETVQSSEVEIWDENYSSSDDLIEMTANLKLTNCNWIFKLSAYYKFNDDGTIKYDATLNLIEANEELRESDAMELSNLLQEINEIMNV